MTEIEFQKSLDNVNKEIEKIQHTPQTIGEVALEPVWWSVQNAMTISASVLVFGTFICALAAFLIRRGGSSDSVLKTLGTLLIIISALFLVVAGYSDKQVAPVMGLLGTIAGYLLGKGSTDNKP